MAGINPVSSGDKASPLASSKATMASTEGKKRVRKRHDDAGAAQVKISEKGKGLAEAMQANNSDKSTRPADAGIAREERMNELVNFYATKLVKASQKMTQEEDVEKIDNQEKGGDVNRSAPRAQAAPLAEPISRRV